MLGFNVGAAASAPNITFDFYWLTWQRTSDNLVEIQLFNGSHLNWRGLITNSPFDASWNIVGNGDFEGDGVACWPSSR